MGIFVTALIVPKMYQERTVNLASSDYLKPGQKVNRIG
jgi:hypothetical protein